MRPALTALANPSALAFRLKPIRSVKSYDEINWLRLLDRDPQGSQNIASSRSWPNLDFQPLAVHADDITPTSKDCSAVLDIVENIYRDVRSYL
jgi:hypothetical protein